VGGSKLDELQKVVKSETSALEYVFNESMIVAAPAALFGIIALFATLDFYSPDKTPPIIKYTVALSSWLIALAAPMTSALVANRMGRVVQKPEHFKTVSINDAARGYLFIDGTFGLIPNLLLSIILATFSYASFLGNLDAESWLLDFYQDNIFSWPAICFYLIVVLVLLYLHWAVVHRYLNEYLLEPTENPAKLHFLTLRHSFTLVFWRLIYTQFVFLFLYFFNVVGHRLIQVIANS
jgi:hypothetical protein